MEHVTPGQLFFGVGGGLAIVITIMVLHACWPEIAAIGRAVGARYMSSSGGARRASADDRNSDDRAVSLGETNSETAETARRVAEMQAESFTLGETTALARLVAAGEIGLTAAVKIGADAKSGEKYSRRSRQIKAAVEQLQQSYPPLTPEHQRALR